MKLFAISIRGDSTNLLRDNFLDKEGIPHSGVLFFKRKDAAEEECVIMNKLRKGMKISECYSVVKADSDDTGIYGKIVDGKQI